MAKEAGFRPTTFDDFSGQDKIKRMLKIYIKAAQMKNEQLDHILIAGPSGGGKNYPCQYYCEQICGAYQSLFWPFY